MWLIFLPIDYSKTRDLTVVYFTGTLNGFRLLTYLGKVWINVIEKNVMCGCVANNK